MKKVGEAETMHAGSAQVSDGLALGTSLSARTETARYSEQRWRWCGSRRGDGDGAALTTPVRRAEDGNGDFTVETSRRDLGYDGP
jgi:hypothetical protein